MELAQTLQTAMPAAFLTGFVNIVVALLLLALFCLAVNAAMNRGCSSNG